MKQFFEEYGGVTIVLVVIAVLLLLVGTACVKADGTVEGNGVSGLVTNFMNETIGKLNINNPTLDGNGGTGGTGGPQEPQEPVVPATTSMMGQFTLRPAVPSSATTLHFTDIKAPDGVTTTDLTEVQDGTIVGWLDGTTYYVSSQVQGTKILFNENCYGLFNYGDADSIQANTIIFDNVDTSQVIDMSYMFSYRENMSQLDLSSFDTSNVTNMSSMFNGCLSLTSLDLSSFDTSNVTNMSEMFKGCVYLTSLTLGDNWNTSNVTNMSKMFFNAGGLSEHGLFIKLDCSSWDVSKVTKHDEFYYNPYNDGFIAPNWVN